MIDHDGAKGLMAQAMDKTLGADEERELALHLVSCAECKSLYESLQKADPALSAVNVGTPSAESVDAAVQRAVTVLRGEADPGPMGLSEEPPRLPDLPDSPTIKIDTSRSDESTVLAPPVLTPPARGGETGPLSTTPEAHVRPIETEVPQEAPAEAVEQVPAADEDAGFTEAPLLEPFDQEPETEPEPEPVRPEVVRIEAAPETVDGPLPPVTPERVQIGPRSDVDALLDEDRARYEVTYEPAHYEDDDDRDRMGPGPWLIAIAVTVALAVLAGILITRGEGLFGGSSDLPSATEVKGRVSRALADMKSLKTSFEIQRLGLYRVGRADNKITYSFSNGRYAGSIDYDRAEGHRQDFTLTVGNEQVQRAEIVQKTDETRSVIGSGNDAALRIESNPPLGPPDGALRPALGLLEDSVGGAARLISESEDLKVVGTSEHDGRQTFDIVGTVRPSELSRADKIEAAVDAEHFLPLIAKRSVSRENARILGPASALNDQAIDTAFGTNERLTTEFLQLGSVQYDDIVLPTDLLVDAPAGAKESKSDFKFERLTRATLSKVDFEPLLPRTLPDGLIERQLAVDRSEQTGWGPGDSYPKPQSTFHASYFDGKSTIVLVQKRLEKRFTLKESPLARSGLAVTVREIARGDDRFFYGVSPEVPPHVYGFIGNTFVMASGYATQNELARILGTLAETPNEIPSLVDPTPAGSPAGSPGASPVASPAASPAATTAP